MAFRTGELTERVKLFHKTRTPDGVGGAVVAWEQYAELWALVRPMSGREREQAMRQEASSLYLVVIRNRADVLDADTIEWQGRNLNIRFSKGRGTRAPFLEIEAELGARI